LPGVKVEHFRSFLRILYPFIDKTSVFGFDDWVGVLNLATMWLFPEIRARALAKLSNLIKRKTVMERIALARKYRVAKWLRDAYVELTPKVPLNFEELRPAEPHSNSLDTNWEETARDWETLARILYLQTKAAAELKALGSNYHCSACHRDMFSPFGSRPPSPNDSECLCKCRILALVDETFRGELESLKENPEHIEHPIPSWTISTSEELPTEHIVTSSSKKKKKGKCSSGW